MMPANWTLKRNLVLAIVCLTSGAVATPLFGAERIFTCTNLVSRVTWLIRINFEASTVDSNPARISAGEISWHDAADGGNYTLDRKSGRLTVVFASSTGGYFVHDSCTPQD